MRVKINQLENDLLHQIKRLDIICKSKGLPRPKKDHLVQSSSQTRGTYVSPYGRNRVSPAGGQQQNRTTNNSRGRSGSGTRPTAPRVAGQSGSQGRGQLSSKFYNSNYTPPNRKPNNYSPSVGA